MELEEAPEDGKYRRWTSKNIALDEKFETIMLDYDGKNDRWNAALSAPEIEKLEAREKVRKNYLKKLKKKLQEKNISENACVEENGSDMHVFKGYLHKENVYVNNHTEVWGSWWKDHQWGYKCCKQLLRNSYCTGEAAAANLM
ncbi:putative pre-mRNA-splicing factor SLU7 [Helianthus annuus]|nr:putative pre-mRNA-splicing factor SLU7 [Helianthus annuus]KAJ0608617.1 putative pre-mRNA-splicing factor SLU7 [Helianthus annuus]KAJ0936389.1 putative pre-mRNA-splicing factor SLU7 [Helianthus annuus]